MKNMLRIEILSAKLSGVDNKYAHALYLMAAGAITFINATLSPRRITTVTTRLRDATANPSSTAGASNAPANAAAGLP